MAGGSANDCQFRSGGRYLRLVLGFYNYYAVPTNFRALNPLLLAHHALPCTGTPCPTGSTAYGSAASGTG
jgi:hypothetical protein